MYRSQNHLIIIVVIPAEPAPAGTSRSPVCFDFWISVSAGMAALIYSRYFWDIKLDSCLRRNDSMVCKYILFQQPAIGVEKRK